MNGRKIIVSPAVTMRGTCSRAYNANLHGHRRPCTGGAQPEAVVGSAMVGGPFQLLDHDGKPFSDRDLRGSWALLYFGFTSCPDICPDELDKMTEALNIMGVPHPPALHTSFCRWHELVHCLSCVAAYLCNPTQLAVAADCR